MLKLTTFSKCIRDEMHVVWTCSKRNSSEYMERSGQRLISPAKTANINVKPLYDAFRPTV